MTCDECTFERDTFLFKYSSDSGDWESDDLINGLKTTIKFQHSLSRWTLVYDNHVFGSSVSSFASPDCVCPSQIEWQIWNDEIGGYDTPTFLCVRKSSPMLFQISYFELAVFTRMNVLTTIGAMTCNQDA